MRLLLLVLLLAGCAPPKVSDLLKGGLDCDVDITMPDETPRARELVKVKARFSNCIEVTP